MNKLNKQKIHENPRFNLLKYNNIMLMYPFNDTKAFEQWLDDQGFSYENFIQFFIKGPKSAGLLENSPWIGYLVNSYVPAIKVPKHFDNLFAVFTDFIVEKATFEFKHRISKIKNRNKVNLRPLLFKSLFTHELNQSLTRMVTPFLNLEFKIALDSKKIIGVDSKESFNSYIDLLTDKDYIITFFEEYSCLLEKLISKTAETTSEFIQFYTRISEDYSVLCTSFGELGTLRSFSDDKHKNFKKIQSSKFCHFDNKKILYIQKPLKIDFYTQQLSIDKKSYIWTEENKEMEFKS